MYKCVVLFCMISLVTYLVASDEKTRKQRKATAPLHAAATLAVPIPQSKNKQFIKFQYPTQPDSSNKLLNVYAYTRYPNGTGSEENSPRDGSLSY
jgi:hypothetical protein